MKKWRTQSAQRGTATLVPRNTEPRLVQIEKAIYGGAFLARVEGKATFVPLTLPGERARVRIVEDKRGYATAEAEEIVVAAPERVAPACRHFGACGGCQYQHADYAAQLEFKKAILREALERGGVRAPGEIGVLAGKPWAYRNRIRLALDAEGNPGFRGRRSHEVIEIAECPIAAPVLLRAALAAAEILRKRQVDLRAKEIALFCDAAESSLLVSVVTGGSAKERFEEFATALLEKIPVLKGVELVVEGREWRAAAIRGAMGREFPSLSGGGVRLPRGPRRVFPSESMARGCARRTRDDWRARQDRVGSVRGCGLVCAAADVAVRASGCGGVSAGGDGRAQGEFEGHQRNGSQSLDS